MKIAWLSGGGEYALMLSDISMLQLGHLNCLTNHSSKHWLEDMTAVRNDPNLLSFGEIWEANRACIVFEAVTFLALLLRHWWSARTWRHALVKCIIYSCWLLCQCLWWSFEVATRVKKRFFGVTLEWFIDLCLRQEVGFFLLNWVNTDLFVWIMLKFICLDLAWKSLVLTSGSVGSEVLAFCSWANSTLVNQVEWIGKRVVHIFAGTTSYQWHVLCHVHSAVTMLGIALYLDVIPLHCLFDGDKENHVHEYDAVGGD